MRFLKFLPKFAYFSIITLGWAKLASAKIKNPLNADNFGKIIENLAQAITAVGIPLAVIFIIYSGFLFVTARGNDKKLEEAKNTFFWAIVGTILIIGAWALASALNEFAQGLGS